MQIVEPPADAQPGMRVVLEGLPVSSEKIEEINLRSKNNKWSSTQPVCSK